MISKSTHYAKQGEVQRNWVLVDADGAVLGRLATQIAMILRGKNKTTFTPNVDCGDHVIIINCDQAVLTGKKLEKKVYRWHTGWIGHLKEVGYPGYSTAAGWLGYSDEKMVRLAKQETEVMGFKQIKLKVGQNLEDDLRRLKLAREAVGPDIAIAVDANQVWDVPQAIEWIGKFKDYDLAWVEEPTCPDDVLGHAAIQKAIDPIPVATGEQMQNRVMYKQYLQAGSFKVMQIDATRVAGPQEIVLEYLLAKKFGVKVCPHAGGVGLCEAISQLAMFDYVSVSGEMEDRVVEYVDNQHEYFVHPTVIKNGRYVAPLAPGNGTEMKLDECMKYLHKD